VIGIIIASYNDRVFLEDCLDSIYTHTKDFKISEIVEMYRQSQEDMRNAQRLIENAEKRIRVFDTHFHIDTRNGLSDRTVNVTTKSSFWSALIKRTGVSEVMTSRKASDVSGQLRDHPDTLPEISEVNATAFLEQLQEHTYEGYERTIDAHVKNLRKKLGDDPHDPRFVETVRGVGYRLLVG